MQLKPEQLDTHLGQQLAPVYFISGDEPLRVMEAADAVRAAALARGYMERDVLTVQPGFDWYSLQAEAGNLSLFSQQRIIDLRLPTGKPGKEGAQALRDYADNLPDDTLLLITAGKLEQAARKSKWVQALDTIGVVVFVWPLDAQAVPAWLEARMRRRGLAPSRDAVVMLADRVEGNLLAGVQEIDKLYLLQGEGEVNAEAISRLVADNARFDVFALVDAALAGKVARSVRILGGLEAEGVAPQIVLWALAREIRQLATMSAQLAGGQSLAGLLTRHRVWTNRKTLVGQALKRLSSHQCSAMLRRCAGIDRISKGRGAGNAWDELLQLTCELAGKPVLASV